MHVYEPSNGPPSGAPVLIKFTGTDLDALEHAVSKTEDILKSIPGTSEVETSTKNNGTQFVLSVDKAKATALGLKCAFLNQPVEVAKLRPELAALVSLPGRRPDIVMRFGYGPTLPYSARRPIERTMLS